MKIQGTIDDLLEIVDYSLVCNYERFKFGQSQVGYLSEINGKLKKSFKDYEDTFYRCKRLFIFLSVLTGLVAAASSFPLLFIDPYTDAFLQFGRCALVGGISLITFWVRYPETKRRDWESIRDGYLGRKLEDFRKSLELLRSPVGRIMRRYTTESIRDNFLTYAVQIMDAENKLDKVRRAKKRDIFEMSHLCSWIMKRQEDLVSAEQAAKSFGLEFDKGELFAEAKKHIEQSYAHIT